MVMSDLRPEVEILPFLACAMHPAIIIETVRSLRTWLWGRYHVPQKVFLVFSMLSHTFLNTTTSVIFLSQTSILNDDDDVNDDVIIITIFHLMSYQSSA